MICYFLLFFINISYDKSTLYRYGKLGAIEFLEWKIISIEVTWNICLSVYLEAVYLEFEVPDSRFQIPDSNFHLLSNL